MSGTPRVLAPLAAAALAMSLAASLAACSSGSPAPSAASSSAPTVVTTVTVTATASPSASASSSTRTTTATRSASGGTGTASGNGGTAEFVRVVRARVPDVAAGRTTSEIAAIATTACRSLRAGRPAERITAEARSLGTLDAEATDDATARELVKLAIDTTCLDQARRVDQF